MHIFCVFPFHSFYRLISKLLFMQKECFFVLLSQYKLESMSFRLFVCLDLICKTTFLCYFDSCSFVCFLMHFTCLKKIKDLYIIVNVCWMCVRSLSYFAVIRYYSLQFRYSNSLKAIKWNSIVIVNTRMCLFFFFFKCFRTIFIGSLFVFVFFSCCCYFCWFDKFSTYKHLFVIFFLSNSSFSFRSNFFSLHSVFLCVIYVYFWRGGGSGRPAERERKRKGEYRVKKGE